MKVRISLKRKVVLGILILAFILTGTAIVSSYRVYADTMDTHYRALAEHVAKTAAVTVDTEEIKKYTERVKEIYLANPAPALDNEEEEARYLSLYEPIQDDGYRKIFERLENVKLANGVQSLYITYLDAKSMTGVYIVDADRTETACPMGAWGRIYETEGMKTREQGFPAYITNTEEFGWLCSAGAPIFDEDGGLIAHAQVDISMNDVMKERHQYLVMMCVLLLAVTLAMTVFAIWVVNRAVVKPVDSLARAASSYVNGRNQGDGPGSEKLQMALPEIHTGDEVENLCMAFRQMEQDINSYIDNLMSVTAEKERIGAELNVATHIQAAMLPCIFPPFPDREEFDIYATMSPAREVGGDFYDFFLVDEDHLAVVMADVSGKGVPAALFMVIAKTLIKDHTQVGGRPADVFTEVNEKLCESNEEGLFVTAWMGVLEISTGKMTFVNAGHNPPLLRQKDGSFTYLRTRSGFVLAGMEGLRYRQGELSLNPGDMLYLYTDGVTEAMDESEALYGEERLKQVLDAYDGESPEELLGLVKADIDAFAGEAPQADDITMLALRIGKAEKGMKAQTFAAELTNLGAVQAFIESELETAGCSVKNTMLISAAVEEIFVNIARYAYAPESGDVKVESKTVPAGDTFGDAAAPARICIRFTDSGRHFNPLEKEDADTTLSAEDRPIGGLGILMVKRSMDKVGYEYRDGKNILTMEKEIK